MDYRREIDGLRALAVLPVILFHAGFEMFSGGFVGVDVFFVISGYLITTIILSELEQGRFSIVNFYERRARRILPALFLVMLVCIPFAWFLFLPGDMKDFSQSLVAVSVFASNILFWHESGYFDTAAELKPLLHTWSLAVEEQYYLLFPLFLMLFWRLGKRWILVLLAIVGVASFFVAQWASLAKPMTAFYLLPTRGWELLIGAFSAFYLSKASREEPSIGVGEVGGCLGLSLILYAVFFYSKTTPFPGIYALTPTIGAVLIILFATEQTTIGKFIGNKVFVGVGLVSYSAYLWHQPLFSFIRTSPLEQDRSLFFLLILITFILAYISWRYVENPFRDKKKFTRAKVFILSAMAMIFFIIFGLLGHKSNGFEGRASMAKFDDLAYDTSTLGYTQCDNFLDKNDPKLNYCYGEDNDPTALVVGDSHADDKFYGIEKAVPAYNWRLVGNSSCPPLYGVRFKSVDGTECTERLKKIFTYIDQTKSVKLVVLSFMHMYPLDTLIAADHIQLKFNPEDSIIEDGFNPSLGKIDAFYSGLNRTIEFLHSRKIKTVILLDIPELLFFPSGCLKDKAECIFEKSAVIKRQEIIRSRIARLSREYKDLLVFDPLDIYCDNGACKVIKDGHLMYRDSHHLTHFGSLRYGDFFSNWYLINAH
ncbi:MAG: acyltransferase [Moraxellaceae bacterium]|nr:acyltransferase [Moraxellaceae bacterium]MBP8851384.1 acyltransferase [Moraxellaceae bacterium]MBP9044943.1 acyltransferase [Moraxellaceae bacterium]MBP9730122.1 acyltransferase [Moraxellaceae bacterium]MCC6200691.1 acyltransferase [Moraxellaceae bacterium]